MYLSQTKDLYLCENKMVDPTFEYDPGNSNFSQVNKVVFHPDKIIGGGIQTQQCNKFAAINWHCLKKIEATLTDWFRSTFRLRRHFRRFFSLHRKSKFDFDAAPKKCCFGFGSWHRTESAMTSQAAS